MKNQMNRLKSREDILINTLDTSHVFFSYTDAVTVVLYHTVEGMNCFLEEGHSISMMMYVTALLKFFATSFGGILIGIIYGALTSVLTKYTVETRGMYYHFCLYHWFFLKSF